MAKKKENEAKEACQGCEEPCCVEDCEISKVEADEETVMLLEKLTAEKEEYLDALKRERADFENYKKRNAAVAATAYKDGMTDAVKKLLPTVDNLERALLAAQDDEGPLKEGVSMVLKGINDAFREMGVEEIDTSIAFDPNFHNAVMQVPAEEGEEQGTIKEVFQKGYTMNGKVLRYSMVKVIM